MGINYPVIDIEYFPVPPSPFGPDCDNVVKIAMLSQKRGVLRKFIFVSLYLGTIVAELL